MSLSTFKQNRDVLGSVFPKLWAVFDCCYTMKYNTSMNKGSSGEKTEKWLTPPVRNIRVSNYLMAQSGKNCFNL